MATETTKIPFVEGAAPATPAASRVVTYAKADGLMYSKDDAGVETLMSGGDAAAHIADTTAAHAASAIAFTPNGSIAATDVQAAIQEVRDEAGAGGTVDPSICQGRLTLTTAVPITTSDVTAATTLYFTPFRGNLVSTYSGAAWSTNAFTEKSITLATLTAGLPYDVFIVDSTLALELVAWTNTTTRATALALQDGVYCKTGALTRRYLGTICIVATGQCEDSLARRMVWNAYNRVERPMKYVDTTDSWTYATTAWQQMRGQSTAKVEFVIGLVEDAVKALMLHMIAGASGQAAAAGIGLDSATVNSAETFSEVSAGTAVTKMLATARYRGFPAVGYHYLAPLEYRRAGTCTFFGDDGIADQQTGLTAEVMA